jgi:uncharacterized membrane protein HdeD (DUF308 family)
MTEHKRLISIWFFIGVLLLVYGIVILAAGIYDTYIPPPEHTVLENLHAAVWWGAFLLVMGAFYTYQFFPHRKK